MEELLKNWKAFCAYMVEVNPNYVDSDFSFNNFMDWYETYYEAKKKVGHSIDADGHCNLGCC